MAPADEGSGDLQEFGYQQELKRRLGGFQMFAISFAFISVAVGIFGTYGRPFALSIIVGLATLVGFDAAANLAEEAKDPFRTVPRAIVGSVVAAALLGMVFLIALTVAIPDIPSISQSASPVADIMRLQLGSVAEKGLLVVITFAFFAAGMVTMATGARLVYAMARDSRFPAHRLMRKVDPRTQTPIPARS
ncbi:MAG: amino acid permease [Ilumatobacteraceae bacterium]